jgi:hypothetical protein
VISTESINNSYSPSLAVDNYGNAHIAWYERSDYAGSGSDYDIFYKFWDASSGKWSGHINSTDVVSTESNDTDPEKPSITVDTAGNVHIVWEEPTNYGGSGGDFDIFYKNWNASSGIWSGYINNTDVISTESTGNSYRPSIATDESGNIHIAWQDFSDYTGSGSLQFDIFYKMWNITSKSWNGNINATDVVSMESTEGSTKPSLEVDNFGNVHITWEEQTDYGASGTDIDISYKLWNASTDTWSGHINATDVISTESINNSHNPSLAVDNYGNVHIAWQEESSYGDSKTDKDIFYKNWNASSGIWRGKFNKTDIVSTESTGNSYLPSIAADESGNIHIAWQDYSEYNVSGTDSDIFYKLLKVSKDTFPPNDNLWIVLAIVLGTIGGVVIVVSIILVIYYRIYYEKKGRT